MSDHERRLKTFAFVQRTTVGWLAHAVDPGQSQDLFVALAIVVLEQVQTDGNITLKQITAAI